LTTAPWELLISTRLQVALTWCLQSTFKGLERESPKFLILERFYSSIN
jgi:hypothetical protein